MTRDPDARASRNRRRPLRSAAVFVLIGWIALVSLAISGRSWSAELGDPAPELSQPDLQGRTVTLEDFENRAILVNVWATYCLPCRHEMPLLDEMAETHRDRGLVVLGVSIDGKRAEDRVRSLVEDLEISYPILLDPEEKTADLFPAPALPASFLFDHRGRLQWKRLGVIVEDDPELQEALREALPPEDSSGTASGW
ncbi:MAG: TlpA disulfide reductase family protein [Thermoanaerobaculia bacterium]|nr:TlpA disulfide reductase family protein [Thermoanaerobaculia bacterium]